MTIEFTPMQKKFLVALFAKLSEGQDNKAIYSYLALKMKRMQIDMNPDEMRLTKRLIDATISAQEPLLKKEGLSPEVVTKSQVLIDVLTQLGGKLECNLNNHNQVNQPDNTLIKTSS